MKHATEGRAVLTSSEHPSLRAMTHHSCLPHILFSVGPYNTEHYISTGVVSQQHRKAHGTTFKLQQPAHKWDPLCVQRLSQPQTTEPVAPDR